MGRRKASTASKDKIKSPVESKSYDRKIINSFTIKRINKTITLGDCVLMRPFDSKEQPYVAKIDKIEADSSSSGIIKVYVRWFYRPEDTVTGRMPFHAKKELFLSNHKDVNHVETIEDTCVVHHIDEYAQSNTADKNEFFWRLEYDCFNQSFRPDSLPVFCKCEMPSNPDDPMIRCEKCHEWFHPGCVDMTEEEVGLIDHFSCESCEELQGGGQNMDTPMLPSTSDSHKRRRLKKGS